MMTPVHALSFGLGLLVLGLGAALADLFSEEVRERLDRLPATIVSLASRRLPREIRTGFRQRWQADLGADLAERRFDRLPITRLLHGLRVSVGLLGSAGRVGRDHRRMANQEGAGRNLRILERISDGLEEGGTSLMVGTLLISFIRGRNWGMLAGTIQLPGLMVACIGALWLIFAVARLHQMGARSPLIIFVALAVAGVAVGPIYFLVDAQVAVTVVLCGGGLAVLVRLIRLSRILFDLRH